MQTLSALSLTSLLSDYGAYTGHSTYWPKNNWQKRKGLDLNIFQLKGMLLTKENWKNQNLGSCFEFTS